METRVASVTGQTLLPTLAATYTHTGVVTGDGEGMKRQATGEFIEDDYPYITTARTRLAISALLVLSHFG